MNTQSAINKLVTKAFKVFSRLFFYLHTASGPNLHFLCMSGNWMLPHFVKNMERFILMQIQLEKGLNRGYWNFRSPFFKKCLFWPILDAALIF